MPEFVYYIIGAVLAIAIMAIIILCNNKNKKNACCTHSEQETCCTGEHNHSEEAEEVENTEEINSDVKENPTDEVTENEVTPEVAEVEENNASEVEENNTSEINEDENNSVEEAPVENEQPAEKELSKKEKLNRYRVTYDKTQQNWVVKMDGATRASKRCATKEEALKVAKELAKKKDSKLSVHKKDGKFQKKANIK